MYRQLMGERKCQDFWVRYYLLEERSASGNAYGVGMERDGEVANLPDLTPSQKRALALLENLIRGQVTPVSLRDVVDDWLLT